MDRLLGIIRTEDALTARLVRQNISVDFTDAAAVEQSLLEESADWYEFVDCPPALLKPGIFPQQADLLNAWEALSDAVVPDTETVRRVLTETVLGQSSQSVLPLPAAQTQAVVKSTAAHPRAYSGTKYKPPKPKAASARDWRPAFCDPRSLGDLAADMGVEAAAELRLPDRFRASLYPLVREQSTVEVAEMLALYWALALDGNPQRLAAASYLFSLQCRRNTCAWCRLITGLPPEQWTRLLHLLIESGAYAAEVQTLSPLFGEMLAEVMSGKDALYRTFWLLHSLTTGIDPEYLLAGYRLADAYEQSYRFHAVRRSGYFPMTAILRWDEHCHEVGDFYEGTLLNLWEQCGLRPGLGECLEQTDCVALTPNAAWRWLKLLRSSWDNWSDLPESEAEARWSAVRPLMGAMIALVQDAPAEYQDKCVWHLMEYLWQWDTPAELQAHLPSALTLTRRLCRPPFAAKNDPTLVTMDFLANLPKTLCERFLQASDASFRCLEQACRRDNDAVLTGRGTEALTRHQSEFSVHCLETDPTRFFHAAKRLGTLSAPMRDTIVRGFALSEDETPRLALARLEQAAIDILAAGFPAAVRKRAEVHALQIQQVIRDNRRALRKFLSAHWEGRDDYRQTHPLTRQWLAAHPNLALETWQSGTVTHAESEAHGTVTLAVEQNPLEALKLGTYVGSCLGLGGAFAYSAAAVVVDINKQVVYARDKRGTVVGRQLVAISEENQLVCYEVYPLSAQKDLGAAFAEFDTQLASVLGLTIYNRGETENYEIACILSQNWWDDYAWDLVIDTQE